MSQVTYKCPKEKTCAAKKHCHILKTTEELRTSIEVFVKCPMLKKEIIVNIGKESMEK